MINRLPPFAVFLLTEIREWFTDKSGRRSYSQFGEDTVVNRLTAGVKEGTYVDVGAYHPKRGSNTLALYKRGWHGINIEPNPYLIHLFRFFRPRDRNICCGIGPKGRKNFYMFTDGRYNTFSEEHMKMVTSTNRSRLIETRQVDIVPLREILTGIKEITVLNIDAEGLDMEVIESFDWDAIRPGIVLVEAHQVDFDNIKDNAVYAFMKSKDYHLEAKVGYTFIFKYGPSHYHAFGH